jgi:mannose-6-phosphate isomerase-like protein (cupin superfamily)
MDTVETAKKHDLKGKDKKEAFHREAESRREIFRFKRPNVEITRGRRGIFYLCDTDILKAAVQIIPEGGDTDLHYHPGTDGFWYVLQGKVRFYDCEGVIGEFAAGEGLAMPRNARYWFESADTSQELHILQVGAKTQQKVANGFVPVNDRKQKPVRDLRFNYPPGKRIPNS